MSILHRRLGSWIVRLAGALVLLVVLAAAGWWFFIREDAQLATSAPDIPRELAATSQDSRTAATTSSPPGSATASVTATAVSVPAGTQAFAVIPERSEAAYFAGEKLASLSLPSTAKGSTQQISGTVYLRADGLDGSLSSSFTVDLRGLKSNESRRDSRVQSALETNRFPTITFTATKVTGLPAQFSATQDSVMQLTGILDLHGVKKEVTWEVKAKKDGNVLTALATVNFKYADFGITAPNIAGFVSVEDNVTLQVQLVAQAKG
ncbi:MAG: YceI family protein [Dehalococcoidia bacterium]|nr:YceI family protein [Dehalococcoidia bacterium]